MRMFVGAMTCICAIALGACVTDVSVNESAVAVVAAVETAPVASFDDAADDPAIWVNPDQSENSIILGTDKQAGLYSYDLAGDIVDFLPAGALNNVDVRQGVSLGDWTGDLAFASNRTDDTLTMFAIGEDGAEKIGAFPSEMAEPYGACLGVIDGAVFGFATHKTGHLLMYRIDGAAEATLAAMYGFSSQLEGCVHDDETGVLYVGEEAAGVWRMTTDPDALGKPVAVDTVGGATGVAADIEGLALYKTGFATGYLIASSQGNNSYAVYDRGGEHAFRGLFRIGDSAATDATEETDGLEATSAPLGDAFPEGVLVVQDGFNRPGRTPQNFKIVDWREIKTALSLE